MLKLNKNKKGFTLIELIVVMSIIGVLVLLAMPKFMGYTKKAHLTEIKSNIKQLENASERYYINKQDWPRLNDTPYSAEQVEEFAKEIKSKTGATITLDPDGKYYDIDYDKLQKYVQKPKDGIHYVLQNPVGEVYFLEDLTTIGEQRLIPNNKPTAVITMNPEQALTTESIISWSSTNSTDPDGDTIVNTEWDGKQSTYTIEGNYTVKLRVQDSKGLWSDWTEKHFFVFDSKQIVKIDAGGGHTIALMKDGTIRTWGRNNEGQLGNGNKIMTNNVVTVSGLTDVKDISAGWYYNIVLLNDGTVRTWGDNGYGNLGDGSTITRTTPTIINGLTNVKQISAGFYHTMALLNDGTVWGWGNNQNGQIGDNSVNQRNSPVKVNIANAIEVSAGQYHTVALMKSGYVMSWGGNYQGQLGGGSTSPGWISPRNVGGITNAIQISSGDNHTLVVLSDGSVKGWGRNEFGQLGDGTTTNRPSPILISGLLDVKQVSAGQYHSLAVLNDGTVKSWGSNGYGRLGIRVDSKPYIPSTIIGLNNIKQVSAGNEFSVALSENGDVFAWGYNASNQLGDGTKIDKSTPTLVNLK